MLSITDLDLSGMPLRRREWLSALRVGPLPKGYANWSMRLLARKVVELEIVESISHETVRRTLKKTA
jgi:hypothetical protein